MTHGSKKGHPVSWAKLIVMPLRSRDGAHRDDAQDHGTNSDNHENAGYHRAAVLFILAYLARFPLLVACFAVGVRCGFEHAGDGLGKRLSLLRSGAG